MTNTGDLIVTGRKSDVFKVSDKIVDELISPSLIETSIRKIPGVADVCVIPYINENQFRKICACIEFTPGSNPTAKDVESIPKNELLDVFAILVPTHYIVFENLLRNSNGKLTLAANCKRSETKH